MRDDPEMRKKRKRRLEMTDVPLRADGSPVLGASDDADYAMYLDWLADYLYRPQDPPEVIGYEQARRMMTPIESAITHYFWHAHSADYPPPRMTPDNGAKHWDIAHRKELSAILSKVPEKAQRVRLLNRFYEGLLDDFVK